MTMTTPSNPMQTISIEKVTLNMGVGKDESLLKRGLKLLEKLTGATPVKTTTKKRIPGWGLRPGLVIGCKVTVRKDAQALLLKLLSAKDNRLEEKNFDTEGGFSFGVPEYIDIEGMEYDPELKIIGFEVAVSLQRPGMRVKKRKLLARSIGKRHRITKQDAITFVRGLGVEVQ